MQPFTLVTGGAGFVGSHLVRALRARGERVRSFDLAKPAHEDDIQGSITDARAIADAVAGAGSVFHLAGNAQLWAHDASIFERVNTQGTELIAQAALSAGVARFVHCSSLTTLVAKQTPIGASTADERLEYAPEDMLGAYPRSKRRAELIVKDLAAAGLSAAIALPTEPLGAGDYGLTPPTKMILDAANGKLPAYIDCCLNFVPVSDLAQGLIAVRDKGLVGERYLLGGDNTPMATLMAMIEKRSGRPAPKMKMPYWVALGAGLVDTGLAAITGNPPAAPLAGVRLAGRRVSFSSKKAQHAFDWRAGSLEAALDETFDWFRAQSLLCKP